MQYSINERTSGSIFIRLLSVITYTWMFERERGGGGKEFKIFYMNASNFGIIIEF